MSNFIANMNKQTIEINKSQIIDGDTVPFLVSYETNTTNRTKDTNCKISSKERFTNPFKHEIDCFKYTRIIRATIGSIEISNIDQFLASFKHEFEEIIGKNTIKSITMNKYQMNKNAISNISVIIVFSIPLNLQYINNFKFPKNWFFFSLTAQTGKNQSKSIHQTRQKQK